MCDNTCKRIGSEFCLFECEEYAKDIERINKVMRARNSIDDNEKHLISKTFVGYYSMPLEEIAKEVGGAEDLFIKLGLI